MVWFPVSRARKLALSDGLCGCFVNTKLHASRLECFSNQQLLEMEESSACGFLETQWQAQHCHRRKETNCANRLETTALQLSMSWLKTPPPTLQRPQQRLDSISSCLCIISPAFLRMRTSLSVYFWKISDTHFTRRGFGISEVIDVLVYCLPGMWVIAEQPDKTSSGLQTCFQVRCSEVIFIAKLWPRGI